MTLIDRFAGPWAFLSNFYRAEVALDGIAYPSVEHAFQAAKTNDAGLRAAICAAATPGDAKRLGRQLRLRRDWEAVKVGVMRDLLVGKFTSTPVLAGLLLATGQWSLIEGNTWGDTLWGVSGGRGRNLLGELLSEVRAGLAASALAGRPIAARGADAAAVLAALTALPAVAWTPALAAHVAGCAHAGHSKADTGRLHHLRRVDGLTARHVPVELMDAARVVAWLHHIADDTPLTMGALATSGLPADLQAALSALPRPGSAAGLHHHDVIAEHPLIRAVRLAHLDAAPDTEASVR